MKLVYAMQSPVVACFVGVREVPVVSDNVGVSRTTGVPWAAVYAYDFKDFLYSDSLALPGIEHVDVKLESVFVKGKFVASDSMWARLSDALDGLPRRGGHHVAAPAPPRVQARAEFLKEFPWLADFLHVQAAREHVREAGGGEVGEHGRAAARGEDAAATRGDEAARGEDAIYEELYKKREEIKEAAIESEAHFKWGVLGGAWTAEHLGVDYDCYCSRAASARAKAFCRKFGLAQSFRCSLRQYGEHASTVLCKTWISRVFHFFRQWERSGFLEDFHVAEDAAASWVEPAECAALTLAASARLLQRRQGVLEIAPPVGGGR